MSQQFPTTTLQAQLHAILDFSRWVVSEPGSLLALALDPEGTLLQRGYEPAMLITLVPLIPLLTNEQPLDSARANGWWVG